MVSDQQCIQCGRCCERWGWGQRGLPGDLVPWLEADRQDILAHVTIHFSDGTRISGNTLTIPDLPRISRIRYWQDTHGRPLRRCPFFLRSEDGKAWCGIHEVKPWVCRDFTPWNWDHLGYAGNCPACREKAP